jgi:hypothetical protein
VARTVVAPGHAVGTAEVAAIGDRYAQVAERAIQGIMERRRTAPTVGRECAFSV